MPPNKTSSNVSKLTTDGKSQAVRSRTTSKVAAAAIRAQERRRHARQQERWERWQPVLGTLGIVVAALVLFISLAGGASANAAIGQLAPPAVANAVTQVSPTTFAAVQTGGLTNPLQDIANTPVLADAAGTPEIVYIGAEYCPYCAAERWSVIVALSRFGTFQGLHLTTSSSTDIYNDTPTFTFVGSSYTSQYVTFMSTEGSDRQQNPLQTPTALEQQLLTKYDAPPYAQGAGGIPFIDIANQQLAISSGYSPQILSGLTWQQIANDLSDPNNTVTQQIVGNANYLTAAICQATDQQPAAVCQAAPIPAISQKLGH